jgi:hypothetical protein
MQVGVVTHPANTAKHATLMRHVAFMGSRFLNAGRLKLPMFIFDSSLVTRTADVH